MACVKADGYGHGMLNVAQALTTSVDGFAVACLDEAVELRDAGVKNTILLLEGAHHLNEVAMAAEYRLTLNACSLEQLAWLGDTKAKDRPSCWLKIDTGMHRLGIAPAQAPVAYETLLGLLPPGSKPVVSTHFASADSEDPEATLNQLNVFDAAIASLGPVPQSCANSAGVMRYPQSHRSWVRPGYMLYGGSPFSTADAAQFSLKPTMCFESQVIALRDVPSGEAVGYGGRWRATRNSRIATLAAGYGDGYPRLASDGTPVQLGQTMCPLVGRVSMDMLTIDVTEHPNVNIGDRATLWGEEPHVDAVAAAAGTIGYELLAGMPRRVPRVLAD